MRARLGHFCGELQDLADKLGDAEVGPGCQFRAAASEVRQQLNALAVETDDLLNGETSPRSCSSTHPGDSHVVTGCNDGMLRLIETESGYVVHAVKLSAAMGCVDRTARGASSAMHLEQVWATAWHPSGSSVATGCSDGTVRIVSTEDGRVGRAILQDKYARAIAWNPAGSLLAVGCFDRTLYVVDPIQGRIEWQENYGEWVWAVTWDPSGQRLASGCANGKVRVVNVKRRCTDWEVSYGGPVRAIAWNPSESFLAVGCDDGTLRIVDAESGRTGWEVPHGGPVRTVAWSPSGSLLASGCLDRKLRIFSTATGSVEREISHSGFVLSVAWSPSGAWLAAGCEDGMLRLFNTASWRVEREIEHSGSVEAVAWKPVVSTPTAVVPRPPATDAPERHVGTASTVSFRRRGRRTLSGASSPASPSSPASAGRYPASPQSACFPKELVSNCGSSATTGSSLSPTSSAGVGPVVRQKEGPAAHVVLFMD